jgi:ribosomal protein L22
MEAKSIGGAAGAEVVALGANAACTDAVGTREQRLALLGYLFWFSVSEMAVGREDLIGAMEDSGLEMRFAPGEVSDRDAFRRATSSLARSGVPMEANSRNQLFGTERRRANLLIRDVRRRGRSVVRQVVREVVDAIGATLEHKAVGQLELSGDEGLSAFPLTSELLDEERDLLAEARPAFEDARRAYDSGAVRRVVFRALSECCPVALRVSGGVYFIPTGYEPTLRSIERFVAELKDRLKQRVIEAGVPEPRSLDRTLVMAVELVDREDYRDAIAASLDEQVDREANALIREMADVLKKQRSITSRRQEDFFERVRSLKKAVSEYESLLEREVTDARANLELAQSEAVSMLSKIEVR